MTAVRELDGADAGGQFLRTALSLAVLENDPVRLENVRGDRPVPGLRHQHLAVLETMVDLCDADVAGGELGSETVEFDPGLSDGSRLDRRGDRRPILEGGDYDVEIGTAGSATLLFDALLPLASILESRLSVTVSGGTDVAWSPPLDYFRQVKLPALRRFGLSAVCEVDRRGFYPAGGGRATVRLWPSKLDRLELLESGSLEGVRVYSTEAAALADRDVARRQAEGALERLSSALGGREADDDRSVPIEVVERRETTAASECPGSAIVLRLDHEAGVAGCSALGERGTPAERVGETAADRAIRHLEGGGAVDRHLADQLLVMLAIAGGEMRIPAITDHVAASRELLAAFGVGLEFDREAETVLVSVP
ncbi:RNA 3'-terminal phosphate cyclase [Natrarchaeobius oligotrophus]|uniref:RNA 3'-terminal phosphate cyclase n=1 Tax=Natrarchaeobius chitinivorans TaxID=1679083 RepID=A0A3N6N935_NATCH|nr:RNA 3'-terminal phosphate cyclase [Natrarchaeobius chitinivorans]RQG95022.1 RNA 3'-terminal phosphate cyclase [Natrarchaeobius chitinivorans]